MNRLMITINIILIIKLNLKMIEMLSAVVTYDEISALVNTGRF